MKGARSSESVDLYDIIRKLLFHHILLYGLSHFFLQFMGDKKKLLKFKYFKKHFEFTELKVQSVVFNQLF